MERRGVFNSVPQTPPERVFLPRGLNATEIRRMHGRLHFQLPANNGCDMGRAYFEKFRQVSAGSVG